MSFLLPKGSYLFLLQIQFFLNKAADLVKRRSLCGLQAPARLHDAIPAKPKRDWAVLYFCKAAGESAPLVLCGSIAEQFTLYWCTQSWAAPSSFPVYNTPGSGKHGVPREMRAQEQVEQTSCVPTSICKRLYAWHSRLNSFLSCKFLRLVFSDS